MKDFGGFEKRFKELWNKPQPRSVISALESLECKIVEQNRDYRQALALLRKVDKITTLEELNTFKGHVREYL